MSKRQKIRYTVKQRMKRFYDLQFLITVAQKDIINSQALKWLIMSESLKKSRYLISRADVFKFNWALDILSSYSEKRFRKFVRMNRQIFQSMFRIIEHDFIFFVENNTFNRNDQTPVAHQLFITLYRLSHSGIGADVKGSATMWKIFEGHIHNCTRKVVMTLCKKRDQYVKWSKEKKRKRESMINDARQDFIECIEKLNDSDIVLARKSEDQFDDEIYFNRKKRYVMDLLVVCDSKKMFTYMLSGWFNSQHDVRVYAFFKLNRRPEEFFSEEQYLLADSVYASQETVVFSYKVSAINNSNNKRFNKKLSSIRVDIEHVFDMLKERWQSLIELRLNLYNKSQHEFIVKWIIVCVTLHNILLILQDSWQIVDGWWIEEDEKKHDDDMIFLERQQTRLDLDKREFLKEVMLGTKGMWKLDAWAVKHRSN